MENLPVWTATPNWKEGVLERLEWKTGVLVSTSGAEQRTGVRAAPRRSFEIATWAHGAERAWLDHAIHAAGASRWYVPLFHDPAALLSAGAEDDTTIYCDTEGREFHAGGYAVLRGATPFVAEAVEIVSAGAGSLTLAAPGLTRDWPAGTRIWPAEKGRIAEMPVLTRKGDRTAEVRLRFDLEGAQEWTAASLAAAYDGLPVLTAPPNERESITHEHARIMSLFTTDLAPPVVADTAGVGLVVQMHHWMLAGRDEHNEFRALLYALAGRRVPLWLPTFMADLTLAAPVADTDEEITVAMCGCSTFGVPRSGREHIAIQLRNGSNIYAQVTAAAEAPGGTTEILTLAAPLGVNVDPADVTRISWMAKARLDQDSVEITHHTDTMGVSSVSAAFRTTPESRSASVPTFPSLANTEMLPGQCGYLARPLDPLRPIVRAAFSQRNVLFSSYTGPLFDVRRASDDAVRYAPMTLDGELDIETFDEWVGALGYTYAYVHSTWYDQSGQGRHATPYPSDHQIKARDVDTGTPLGFDVWRSEDRFDLPSSLFSGCTSGAQFILMQQTGTFCGGASRISQSTLPTLSPWSDGAAYDGFLSGTQLSFSPYERTMETTLHCSIQTGTALRVLRNGVQVGSDQTVTFSASPGASGYRLGDSAGGAVRVVEAVFLSRVPTTGERQLIEAVLLWNNGLQSLLPSGHPYQSSAPAA